MIESKPEYQFTVAEGARYFGYFRAENLAETKTFQELEEDLNPDYAEFLSLGRHIAGASEEDIPIVLDLPPRPDTDIAFVDMKLSMAELAGCAAAIKLKGNQNALFLAHTYLGTYARRWFSVDEVDSTPKSQQDNWIVEARGTTKLAQLDPHPSIIYRTSDSLFEEFGISLTFGERRADIDFGNLSFSISDQGAPVSSKTQELDRTTLHVFLGFARTFYLQDTARLSQSPRFNFVNMPLYPFSTVSGVKNIESILKTDRIQAYL